MKFDVANQMSYAVSELIKKYNLPEDEATEFFTKKFKEDLPK